MRRLSALLILLLIPIASPADEPEPFPRPQIEWDPRVYHCYKAYSPITIDGKIDTDEWKKAPDTADFVDITGDSLLRPRYFTRVKMMWDDENLYIAAWMDEPHVWGTLTERDAVIFHDNDFEIFIDPDGDTHQYYELEINALGTEWDLFLVKPYRDGGPAIDSWDIQGLKTAVAIDGTINDPSDVDNGWLVEIAIPWEVLGEAANKPAPPHDGNYWRVNFSRVEWWTEVVDGKYVKQTDPETGRPLAEDNWVWSPQGLINMHYPEMWGVVKFVDEPPSEKTVMSDSPWLLPPNAGTVPTAGEMRWQLRRIYYAQRDFFNAHGHYTADLDTLEVEPPPEEDRRYPWPPELTATDTQWQATLRTGTLVVTIDHEGRARAWEDPDARGKME